MPKPKKVQKKSPPAPARGPSVRVRMYRSGLGDCFLITFNPGGEEAHVLIDCGTLGARTTGVKLDEVVADIRQTTRDHLQLLIATHEHQDHVSGFRSCREEFEKMRVDRVWLAWTENPADPNARQIMNYRGDLGAALMASSRQLADPQHSDPKAAALGEAIQSLLGFAGDPLAASGGLATSIDEAMDFVRTGFGREALYKKPGGAAIEEAWLPGFRFYVLGPPTDATRLSDLGDHDSEELYHVTSGLRVGADAESVAHDEREREMPFDARLRIPPRHELARAAQAAYGNSAEAWRRIDSDWLHAAGDLALQLDSMTNNTSLALAIERISDGRVLLFPADAQQGSWLSWHAPNLTWTYQESGVTKTKTASQLLAETVFYKVGHHSSHNATARGKGLELMQREEELVAFIPVDRAVALGRYPKDSWQMPARALYRRLLEKCQGRVVRSDLGWAEDARRAKDQAVEKEFQSLADAGTWAKWKQSQAQAEGGGRVQVSRLYIDFVLT